MTGLIAASSYYTNNSLNRNALFCAHVRRADSFNKIQFFFFCIILWKSWTWRIQSPWQRQTLSNGYVGSCYLQFVFVKNLYQVDGNEFSEALWNRHVKHDQNIAYHYSMLACSHKEISNFCYHLVAIHGTADNFLLCGGFDHIPPKRRSSVSGPGSQTATESPGCAEPKKKREILLV